MLYLLYQLYLLQTIVKMAQERRNNFANYSEATRGRIVGLIEQGLSVREVAQQVGCNIKTVELWRRKFRELGPDGLKDHRKQNRGPKKTTPEQDAQMLNVVRNNPFVAAEQIIPEIDVNISKWTVIRRIKGAGLISSRPTKKCVLSERHRQQRLAFANQHLNKPQEEWDKWIWSDEKVFSSAEDGRLRVWRPKGARLQPQYVVQEHHSGRISCSFWGSMSAAGIMELHQTTARMTAVEYVSILETVMLPNARARFPADQHPTITFVQDNSAVHNAHVTRNWFNDHPEVEKIDWPCKSPDLNPIEDLWGIMLREWRSGQHRTRDALIQHVNDVWNRLRDRPEICQHLSQSMRTRLQQVIDNNGYWINY